MCRSFNEKGNLKCVALKNIHTPHEGHFCFQPPPPPPGISLIFQLGWIPPGMNILVKNAFALYFYAILFLGYREKKIFMFTLIQCQII